MQKIIKAFVISCLVFILTSCGTNNLGKESAYGGDVNSMEGVSIALTEDTYQSEGDSFELVVTNHSDEQITYGVSYILEYNNEGTWFVVEPDEEIAFILIAHLLGSGEEATEEINLMHYEPLEVGYYRIVREIEGEPLIAEFEVVAD